MKLYVLLLEGGKYYVGKTQDVQARFAEHIAEQGSAWTSLYPPIEVIETREMRTAFDEDAITKEYMSRHGVNNVRGGAYSKLELDEVDREALRREMWGATERCFTCGAVDHFDSACPRGRQVQVQVQGINRRCARCFRNSHTTSNCFANTNIYGNRLGRRQQGCFRCGRQSHYVGNCYATTHVNGFPLC
jgi:predicted GIY-YIG superfamily endonuclease